MLDPFDCEDDPCHLAWIFNDNLLNLVKNAQCSNGTSFKDLDPSFFSDCKVSNFCWFNFFRYVITILNVNEIDFKGIYYDGVKLDNRNIVPENQSK